MTLIPMREDHLEKVLAWRNQEVNRKISFNSHLISMDEHLAWFSRLQDDPNRFSFVYVLDDRECGVVNISDFDPLQRSAIWGFFLDSEGLGDNELRAWQKLETEVIKDAGNSLQLNRLSGDTFVENAAVIALHKRLGLEITREFTHIAVDGTEHEVVEMTLDVDRKKTLGVLCDGRATNAEDLSELRSALTGSFDDNRRWFVSDAQEWIRIRESNNPSLSQSWPDVAVYLGNLRSADVLPSGSTRQAHSALQELPTIAGSVSGTPVPFLIPSEVSGRLLRSSITDSGNIDYGQLGLLLAEEFDSAVNS